MLSLPPLGDFYEYASMEKRAASMESFDAGMAYPSPDYESSIPSSPIATIDYSGYRTPTILADASAFTSLFTAKQFTGLDGMHTVDQNVN